MHVGLIPLLSLKKNKDKIIKKGYFLDSETGLHVMAANMEQFVECAFCHL